MLRAVRAEDAAHEAYLVDGKGRDGDRVIDSGRAIGVVGESAEGDVRKEAVAGARPCVARKAVGEAALEFHEGGRRVGLGGDEPGPAAEWKGDDAFWREGERLDPAGGTVHGFDHVVEDS